MNNDLSSTSNSNSNSSEEVYLTLAQSYINATRDILNGYMRFETGLTRAMNSQIFRNFTRSSLITTAPVTATPATATAVHGVTQQQETSAVVDPINERIPDNETTPANLIRRDAQIPDAPIRPTLRFHSNPPLPSISSAPSSSPYQMPTPVRLTSRLDTPEERDLPRFMLPRRIGSLSQLRESQPSQNVQNVQNVDSTPTPTPPFASSFVRYRLPVPIGPPRRVPATPLPLRVEVPVYSPPQSPPQSTQSQQPQSQWSTQTWQQLRRQQLQRQQLQRQQERQEQEQQQQQEELNSLSPILPMEPSPLPPPLTTASRMVLNLLDTPRFADSLVYYTEVINREFGGSRQGQGQGQGQGHSLSYDIIQQQTKIIPYCTISNPLNDICPISQIPFDLIDSVMQINICKHNFNPYSLIRWFNTNSTCPMCRQQINISVENFDADGDHYDDGNHNGRGEEPYRSELNQRNDYYDSDFSSVG